MPPLKFIITDNERGQFIINKLISFLVYVNNFEKSPYIAQDDRNLQGASIVDKSHTMPNKIKLNQIKSYSTS